MQWGGWGAAVIPSAQEAEEGGSPGGDQLSEALCLKSRDGLAGSRPWVQSLGPQSRKAPKGFSVEVAPMPDLGFWSPTTSSPGLRSGDPPNQIKASVRYSLRVLSNARLKNPC